MRLLKSAHLMIVSMVMLSLLIGTLANGATPIAKSTFDNDDEGWMIVSGAKSPKYSETGGNPSGHIFATDGGSGHWYFLAPSKFLGDVSAAYNQALTFDLRQVPTDKQFDAGDVILTGAGITLVFDTPNNPAMYWTAYRILLNESAGWINKATGESPTQEEMMIVLSSLNSIQIRGEYRSGDDTGYLDNVVLNSGNKKPPEPCPPCPSDVTTSTLAIIGTVYKDTQEVAEDGLFVEVSIITQSLAETSTTGAVGKGQYSVTFVNPQKPVAKAGDEVLITVTDAGGKLVGQSRHTLTAAEVKGTMTRIDVTPAKTYDVKRVAMTLRRGINLVSVPVKLDKELRMSDLAEQIGKDSLSMIIRYDYTRGKFISYLPIFPDDSEANAVVNPSEGYIVVMKGAKEVEFEGTTVSDKKPSDEVSDKKPSDDKIAAPFLQPLTLSSDVQSTSIFVITGNVRREETGEVLNEVSVKIHNLRTGQTVYDVTGILAGSGAYVATFVTSSEEFMTRAGDNLEITAMDRDNRFVITPETHILTTQDISDYVLFMPLHLSLPKKSALLPNYPNPFNPETWMPHQLAQDASVTINIYNAKGQLIRALPLGHKQAGMYVTKDRAAYWDGRDSYGEKVASGVYFYTLQAGDFRATRKMVILK